MDIFQFLTDTTGGKCLFTMLVSMVPIIELRGGLPFGVALGLPYYLAFPAAVLGNLIPAPFTSIWDCGSLWPSPCPVPGPGPALWRPPFWGCG